MKRILITYASYGSGHKTVANYLYNYIKEKGQYEVKIIDLMDYGNLIGKISVDAFNLNFKLNNSIINNVTYDIFDNKILSSPNKLFAKAIIKNKKFKNDILDYKPDILIATHFFASILMSDINKKNLLNCKIMTIITDYKSHCFWTQNSKNEDAIIVGNDIVKNELINNGINKSKIYNYGIPISNNFKFISNKEEIIKKYNLDCNKKTFLFFGGGSLGSTFSYPFLKRIIENNYDINIIFVSGKNEKLKEKVDELAKNNNNIISLGFVDNVHNLMNISNIIITKPGGITITECLQLKKPMLLIPGNGGQEKYNMKYLCKSGYAYYCKSPRELNKYVYKILNKKNMLNKMNIKLDKHEDNKSIEKIYILIEKLLKK